MFAAFFVVYIYSWRNMLLFLLLLEKCRKKKHTKPTMNTYASDRGLKQPVNQKATTSKVRWFGVGLCLWMDGWEEWRKGFERVDAGAEVV